MVPPRAATSAGGCNAVPASIQALYLLSGIYFGISPVKTMITAIFIVSIAVFIYLLYVLLKPDKF